MWIAIVGIGLLLLLLYFRVIKPHKHWEEKAVAHIKPWPIVGSMAPLVFKRQSFAHLTQDFYNSEPEKRYVCFYQFFHPTVLLRDPELIKQLILKNFDIFPEHQTVAPEGINPLWDKNLFGMKGDQKWRSIRHTLSPSFTSSKMKMLFDLMKVCAKQATSHFEKQGGTIEVEMKDVCSRVANDVIGTAAFGVTCDSLENQTNEFYMMGRDLTDFSGLKGLAFFAYTISPSITSLLRFSVISEKCNRFFRGLIKDTLTIREEQGIVRPDMIHLLMEARKGRLKGDERTKEVDSGFAAVVESELGKSQKVELTDEDITAQAIAFFFAGFDTVSSLMSYTSYELALNPDIQDRLKDEVLTTLESCKGNVTYEGLMGIKYLDMVISESLRKWPPVELTDRRCARNFTIEPTLPGEKPLHLDVNTNCWIPTYAIHRDPQHFPNPDKFDPERFSDENKHNIKPFTFFPFGVGPRSCIGSRFALLEAKLIIFEIISKFEIVPVEKTQIPLKLGKGTINMATEGGIWLGLKPRRS